MRLTERERRAVLDAVAMSDPDAQVWLHGSRVDDMARGGDIDLLVLSPRLAFRDKVDLLARLHRALGEQKIDLTIARSADGPAGAFVRLAMAHGERL